MILLNFSHALTNQQEGEIRKLLSIPDKEWEKRKTIRVDCFLNINSDFSPQAEKILDSIPMKDDEWTEERLVVVPPPISHSAILIILGIFAKCGYLPEIVRIKKKPKSTPPIYMVAEIIELQPYKDKMRSKRSSQKIVVKEFSKEKKNNG